MINEKEIVRRWRKGKYRSRRRSSKSRSGDRYRCRSSGRRRLDFLGEQREEFAVEFKAMWTPKIDPRGDVSSKAAAQDMRLYPMMIVPYLNEERLRELERESVSGVDLCGQRLGHRSG